MSLPTRDGRTWLMLDMNQCGLHNPMQQAIVQNLLLVLASMFARTANARRKGWRVHNSVDVKDDVHYLAMTLPMQLGMKMMIISCMKKLKMNLKWTMSSISSFLMRMINANV